MMCKRNHITVLAD